MKRIALDSLPTNRRHLLTALWAHRNEWQTLEVFERATKLSRTTTERNLKDLYNLKAVKRGKQKGKTKRPYVYRLSTEFLNYCTNIGGI